MTMTIPATSRKRIMGVGMEIAAEQLDEERHQDD